MWKKIVFAVVAVAVLGTAGYFYFHLREVKTPVSNAINAVPLDAQLIFESHQSRHTWKKLSEANIMWSDLVGTEFISKLNRNGNTIDSLIGLDPEISKLLENRSVFISLHKAGADNLDFLYLYSLPDVTKQSLLEAFIKGTRKGAEPVQREYDGVIINTLKVDDNRELNYAFSKGILISGFNAMLVESSIRQLNSGISLQNDANFSRILQSAGQKVDGNIYVNYKTLPVLLSRFVSPANKSMASSLSGFASWTEVDATIRPNELMLSGFTTCDDSIRNFLALLGRQKPQDIELTGIIPSNTSSFVFYGLSNFKTFYSDYKTYLDGRGRLFNYEQSIQGTDKEHGINVTKSLLSWIGNEMAMVVTEPSSTDFEDKCYAVFHSNDIDQARQLVNALADSIAKRTKTKQDTESFQGYSIRHLMLPGIIPKLLGSPYEHIKENYYITIGNYMVFGNSPNAMHQFINSYLGGKTLKNDQYYTSFAENNLSEDANLYIYSNIARSPYLYSAYASEEHAKDIGKFMDIYRRFQAIAMQFSSNGKMFYTNIFLKHNPIYKHETNSLWEVAMDTTVSSKPVLVTNHTTKAKEILVQDDGNKIYLISNTGKLLWSRQLDEKIMSDVVQVDGLKNGKLQLMFNTRSTIYAIDRNGKDLQGFPLKLKSPATNGITVLDYENNRDYRILVACENRRLLNLKMSGQLVDGWEFDKTASIVTIPVQYHNIGAKDHLFAVDSKGKVYVMDRHGKSRKVKDDLEKPVKSFCVEEGKDLSHSMIVACDTIGNVLALKLDGDIETVKLKEFNSSPSFDHKDVDNDKVRDFILLDNKTLSVYKADKSLIFTHEFKDEVNSRKALFFLFPDDKGRIGVASPAANEIYLFNPDGQLYPGFPLTGSTLFSIGDINNDGTRIVITASGKTVYAYTIE